VLLTETHLCLMLEYASGGTLTDYVSARYDTVHERGGLFLGEDEARYLFKVRGWKSSGWADQRAPLQSSNSTASMAWCSVHASERERRASLAA